MRTGALPIGGSTGLSHEHPHSIDEAAQWLATTPPRQRPAPLVPAMREMFNLTPVEACAAIRESHLIKARST
ncbi:hypothetical protein D3227_35125 [Mesorhizobium waimense]|uniref:Uncharacterized protein n=1 Tax=Mesorhizobium waimense TaxID=1300307 RepID=A0A3A5KAZ5_9HYPH|nr:hypothetical protein D3227_35125 [Mesorhizobium waimense]